MKTNPGLWIDRRRAILVTVTDQGENARLILSRAERPLHHFGDSSREGACDKAQAPACDSRQRTWKAHLNSYYGAVIASIRQAESVLIFGPDEAKRELSSRLKRANLSGRIVGMEAVDRMTNHQITAKVRQHLQDNGIDHSNRAGQRVRLRSGSADHPAHPEDLTGSESGDYVQGSPVGLYPIDHGRPIV
jgi:hypothetical protein